MKFDEKELMLQHKKDIIRKGEYVHFEIVIGSSDPIPYMYFEGNQYSDYEVAQLVKMLELGIKDLKNKFPGISNIMQFINLKEFNTIETECDLND